MKRVIFAIVILLAGGAYAGDWSQFARGAAGGVSDYYGAPPQKSRAQRQREWYQREYGWGSGHHDLDLRLETQESRQRDQDRYNRLWGN